jgi:hypothetical protein
MLRRHLVYIVRADFSTGQIRVRLCVVDEWPSYILLPNGRLVDAEWPSYSDVIGYTTNRECHRDALHLLFCVIMFDKQTTLW